MHEMNLTYWTINEKYIQNIKNLAINERYSMNYNINKMVNQWLKNIKNKNFDFMSLSLELFLSHPCSGCRCVQSQVSVTQHF